MAEIDVTRIAGNIGAMNALNALQNINKQLSVHQTRLATGKRINSAADDPAGLTIATKMQARSEGLKTALNNIGDAKNLLAVAESGLGRISDIMVQMRNKAEAGASDTVGSKERKALVEQMKAYAAQIDDITNQTKWNDVSLINGDYLNTKMTFQTGADKGDVTELNGLKDMRATNGAASLDLATKAATSTSAFGSDTAFDILTDAGAPTGANALNANLTELSSGTYTVEVTYGGTLGDASTVRLLDSNGKALMIDNDYTAGGTTVVDTTTKSMDLSGAGFQAIDFGNGLAVTVNRLTTASPTANGTYTATVTYSQAGTYSLSYNSSADTIDENSSAAEFANYMDFINTQLNSVSEQLSLVGSLNGRLTFKEDQVSAAQINVEAAYNRVMNANMAEEQVNSSKFQILQQTATAMLAQANQAPQFLLSLFR